MIYGWVSNRIPLLFLDSNVFVYSQIENLPEYELASSRLDEVKKEWQLGINSVFVSESYHALARFIGQEQAHKRLLLFCESSKVIYIPLEKNTAMKALQLAVKNSLKINDMMLAQHALDCDADGLLTDNSKHFVRISGLKLYALRPF